MRKFLAVDPATREVRLVFEDLWRGQHERTEYRVVDLMSGGLVHERHAREWDHLLGQPVTGEPPPGWWCIRRPGLLPDVKFRTQDTAAGPAVITECRRAASKSGRARCPLCPPREPR